MRTPSQFTQSELHVLQAIFLDRYDRLAGFKPILDGLAKTRTVLVTPTRFALPDDIDEMIRPFSNKDFGFGRP